MIRESVSSANHDVGRPLVVVVDPLPGERQHVADVLRRAGFATIEASTPLEAIDVIQGSDNQVEAVAIRDALTQTAGEELASFLAEHHPTMRLALLSGHVTGVATMSSGRLVPVLPIDGELSGPVRDALRPARWLAEPID